jgi:hypothetical protein
LGSAGDEHSVNIGNGMAKIEQGHALEILDRFEKQSDFGEHNIMIYPDLYILREIYSRFCKTNLENNEAVMILSHYDTREVIRKYLRELPIDLDRYEKKERSLLIIDSAEDYFGSAKDFLFYLSIMNENAIRRSKRGILILVDMGSRYHQHRSNYRQGGIDFLLEYEESLPTKLNLKVKLLCLYHTKDFDILEAADRKQYLLKLHFRRYKVIANSNSNQDGNKADNDFVDIPCGKKKI